MENFKVPELLKQMPIAERLINSLMVTLLGMGITFLSLIVLMFVIRIMSKALGTTKKEEAKVVVEDKKVEKVEEVVTDDLELIAVITAAINHYSGKSKNLVVRSYREIGNKIPDWTKAGIDKMINKG